MELKGLYSSKKRIYLLIISLLAISTPATLFLFRSADNNSFVRWSWAFGEVNSVKILVFLILGVVIAYGLSRLSLFERYPSISLFLISFVSSAVFWSEPEFIVDTSRYFIQAKHLELYGITYFFNEWGNEIITWTDLPLIPFLYGLIFRFFEEQRIYIEIFTTLLFSLTTVLTYMIGKRLWDQKTGLYGGLLLLGIPFLFTQAPLMLVDVPTMFFLTLSIFSFIMVMEQGGIRLIAFSSIAVSLAFFSKYSTWPMLSILAVIVLVYAFRKKALPGTSKGAGTAIYRGVIVALISCLIIAPIILLKYDLISGQIRLLTSYYDKVIMFKQWEEESYISIFLFQTHPFITGLTIYSGYIALRKKDAGYAIISYLLILLLIFQIQKIRYLLPIFPMLALTASYGLREIRDIRVRRFIVFCIITSSLVLAYGVFLPFLQKYSLGNLKDAGRYIDTLDTGTIEVFTLPQQTYAVNPAIAVPMLDLFTDKDILYDYKLNRGFGPRRYVKRFLNVPLRFVWEYKNPGFYTPEIKGSGEDSLVVVISKSPGQILPEYVRQRIEGKRKLRVFETSTTGMFRDTYKAVVTIYIAQ